MGQSKDLAKILSDRDSEKYASIIERAANNGYHDFKFDTIPGHPEYAETICPKMQLIEDLSSFPELQDIRKQVMDGVYDDKCDEEDEHRMRTELLDDNTGDSMFKALGFKIPTKEEREQHHKKKFEN